MQIRSWKSNYCSLNVGICSNPHTVHDQGRPCNTHSSSMHRQDRNRQILRAWTDIQEIISPAHLWPFCLQRLFWTWNLIHLNRLLLATFCFVNGLNPQISLEWAKLMHLCRDRAAFIHFQNFKPNDHTLLLHWRQWRNRHGGWLCVCRVPPRHFSPGNFWWPTGKRRKMDRK